MSLALWVISLLLAAMDTLQTRQGIAMGLRETYKARRKMGIWGGMLFIVACSTGSYVSTFIWPEREPLANIAMILLCAGLIRAVRQNAGVLDGDR